MMIWAGLYLAGVECIDNAEAPDGWIKWTIPSYDMRKEEDILYHPAYMTMFL